MTDIQKENGWKKVFDVLKTSLAGVLVMIGFKCLVVLIHISVQFSNMQKDINQMQIEIQQLWKKSDQNDIEHKEIACQIKDLSVSCASKSSNKK